MPNSPSGDALAVCIWGSCVSRDTVNLMVETSVRRYVARHSMISMGNAVQGIPPLVLPSRFQQRMSDWDLQGQGLALMVADAPGCDLILFDLCDERLGVYETAPGCFVTRSVERIAQGIDAQWRQEYRHIPFGCDEHFHYWRQGMAVVMRSLRALRLSYAPRGIALPWAERDASGQKTAMSAGFDAAQANDLSQRYYDYMSSQGIPLLGRAVDVVADPAHQWGPAPFHYTTETYAAVIEEIRNSLLPDAFSTTV